MFLKFINSTEISKYKIINFEETRNSNIRVYFDSDTLLPAAINNNGFEIYSDIGELLNSYENHKGIFDINTKNNYIEFTDNSNIYYDFLVPDENGYIIGITMRINKNTEEGLYLYRSGTSLEYMEWEFNIFNEYGYPLYKIVNEELVETSDEERNAHKEKILKNCLEETKNAKIKEINSFCSKLITAGVVIDGERYSYTLEDQSNILAALQNVKITGMSVPYHSNGNNFRLFSPAEIISIYIAQYKNLIQHTVYTNQLRQYIKNELSIIEDIKAVKYGDALTGNYLNNYNSIINQAMCDIESRLNTQDNI